MFNKSMNLLTFIEQRLDNSFLMQPWFYPVVALCVVALTAALVSLLVAFARVGRRAERVLALVERELEHDVPPLMGDLRELSGELRRLGQGANTELERLGRITERVQEVADTTAHVLNALSGLTRAGQLVGIAAGVKTGVEVFLHRLRTQRGDGHE
jgi:methyl-accepting chemotaxis protein